MVVESGLDVQIDDRKAAGGEYFDVQIVAGRGQKDSSSSVATVAFHF